RSADGSVGSPHARVGHCQASIKPRGHPKGWPFCFVFLKKRMNSTYTSAMKHFHLPVEHSTLCPKNAIFGHLEV
ncbi:MAG: hypothetical protein ACTH9E_11405, partial [Serratia proteamaculans]